jgi:hypothetical protein
LGAAVTKMLSFSDSRLHRKNVLEVCCPQLLLSSHTACYCSLPCEVACQAPSDGRSSLLGVLYDEEVRAAWERKSHRRHAFVVNKSVIEKLDEEALRKAVAKYDIFFGKKVYAAKPEENGTAAGARKAGDRSAAAAGAESKRKREERTERVGPCALLVVHALLCLACASGAVP